MLQAGDTDLQFSAVGRLRHWESALYTGRLRRPLFYGHKRLAWEFSNAPTLARCILVAVSAWGVHDASSSAFVTGADGRELATSAPTREKVMSFPTDHDGVPRSQLRYQMIRLLLMAGFVGMLAIAVMMIVAEPGAAPPVLD